MRSPTQPVLSEPDIAAAVRSGLGAEITAAAELSGGTFAAVWRATLADGREVVVKVAPPAAVPMLGYERGLIPAEAEYYSLVRAQCPGVPVPDVLAVSDDWVITSLLPGRPLSAGDDSPRARTELGAAMARVHAVTGTRFGYTGDRPSGDDWPAALAAIIDSLRADAAAWDVPLPPLDGVVQRYHDVLAAVTRPALLHFDLWDGNVLVGPDGALTGLVDGERYLYGDPLLDLVSPAILRRIEDLPDHPFLAGYRPAAFDPAARIRLALYRIHLYVLMIAEGPSRGIPIADGRHDYLTGLLNQELADLP
ncbi:phosphotransferase [Paractinoplanes rishiriensis]|uniref:Phosphotransferase n=1 Tax=Paractinoplanes rishiriensis TaxID=1050105 RepID=A0A919MMN4_9ACTN|nr:phosphotransferase [Actinoplanes rishiriensis]GIE93141.1 phosphotransferase [Actinoplanes rishiriensis]